MPCDESYLYNIGNGTFGFPEVTQIENTDQPYQACLWWPIVYFLHRFSTVMTFSLIQRYLIFLILSV